MEASTFELQLLVSLAIVLTSAFIALIVDYLKTSNERLREENAALRRRGRDTSRRIEAAPSVERSPKPARLDDIVIGSEPQPASPSRVVMVRPIRKPAEPPNPQPLPVPEPTAQAEQPPEPASAPAETGCIPFPSGWQGNDAYTSWMEGKHGVHGLAVVVGLKASEHSRKSNGRGAQLDYRASLEQILKGSLREMDVAFQPDEDRYVVFFKGESGASAQRRENQFSERLWDFQLRSLGSLPVRFVWGAVVAEGQTFSWAVAAATRRMLEPRQGRRLLSISVAGIRKKAVVA